MLQQCLLKRRQAPEIGAEVSFQQWKQSITKRPHSNILRITFWALSTKKTLASMRIGQSLLRNVFIIFKYSIYVYIQIFVFLFRHFRFRRYFCNKYIYIYIFYLKIVFMKITFFIEIVIRNRPNKWALMINCYILSLL